MFFYASIYLQAKVTIIFGSLAEYLGFFLMFVSARHIFVAQDRRQTAECPDTDGDKRILKHQGLIETQRHVFSKNSPYACQRTWEQTQANLGAETNVSGSRDERVWEQTRTRLPPDSLTGIGSRRIDLKALEADCNAERMASALESRALKIQRKSSLAVAPSQRKFTLRQHNHLLQRQHCSSLCSQSEGHKHVANMTNALGHDFVGFSARAWPPQYSPPHFASKVSYSASPQGFVAPYYLAKNAGFFENLNTLPFRGAVASLPTLGASGF